MVKVFLDSNILIYAHDQTAGEKNIKAKKLVQDFWESSPATISVQVLQEVFNNMIRKGVKPEVAKQLIENYSAWDVIQNTTDILMEAIDIQIKSKTSFWDSLIIAAAREAGADELWSEDLNNGQKIGGIKIINPLL